MANPSKYLRGFSFSGWQATRPTKPLPGPNVDDELSKIAQSITQAIDAIADVRRADGKLKNQIVTIDSLAPDLLFGLQTPVAWTSATEYDQFNAVYVNEPVYFGIYRCRTAHTSAETFAADFGAGRWELIFSLQALADALTPSQALPYVFELPNGTQDINLATLPGSPNNTVNRLVLNGSELVRGMDRDWYILDATTVRLISPIATDDAPAIAVIYITPDGPLLNRFDERYNAPGFGYDPTRSLLTATPYSYTAATGLFPAAGHNLAMLVSPGATLTGVMNRSSYFGTNGPIQIESWDRVDAGGDQSMRWVRNAERVVAQGSLTYPWLSSRNPEADSHAWWADQGPNPGQPGWDAGDGMEVRNPGIGAQIAAFSDFVTDRTQASRNVAMGRNAGGAAVRDINSAYVGYRAGGGVYSGADNAAFGSDALYNGVFVTQFTAVGRQAARYWQTGTRNFVGGRAAAANVVRGSYSTILGSIAGDPFTDADDVVLIGYGAGNNIAGAVQSNILVIGNRNKSTLISGRFDLSQVGVNILPADILGNFHVRSGVSGVLSANANADELVLEASGNGGLSVMTPNTAQAQILFSDPQDQNVGGIIYDHPSDILYLRTSDANRFALSLDGVGFNGAGPSKPTGVPVTAAGVHAALVTLGLISA